MPWVFAWRGTSHTPPPSRRVTRRWAAPRPGAPPAEGCPLRKRPGHYTVQPHMRAAWHGPYAGAGAGRQASLEAGAGDTRTAPGRARGGRQKSTRLGPSGMAGVPAGTGRSCSLVDAASGAKSGARVRGSGRSGAQGTRAPAGVRWGVDRAQVGGRRRVRPSAVQARSGCRSPCIRIQMGASGARAPRGCGRATGAAGPVARRMKGGGRRWRVARRTP